MNAWMDANSDSPARFVMLSLYLEHGSTRKRIQQAIHPTQVATIQSTYVPTSKGTSSILVDLSLPFSLITLSSARRNSSCGKDITPDEACTRS